MLRISFSLLDYQLLAGLSLKLNSRRQSMKQFVKLRPDELLFLSGRVEAAGEQDCLRGGGSVPGGRLRGDSPSPHLLGQRQSHLRQPPAFLATPQALLAGVQGQSMEAR